MSEQATNKSSEKTTTMNDSSNNSPPSKRTGRATVSTQEKRKILENYGTWVKGNEIFKLQPIRVNFRVNVSM